MDFVERSAPAELARLVECTWMLDGGVADSSSAGLVTPDGCVELVFGLDGTTVNVDGRELPSFVLGLSTRPQRLAYSKGARLLGVRMRASGALRVFGGELRSLTDRAVDATDVLPASLRALCNGVEHSELARVREEVLAHVQRGSAGERAASAVELIQRRHGRIDVAEVARFAGVSTRQLDRDFERCVGVAPKLVARIARFRRAFEWTHVARRGDWAQLAERAGYADQGHLIREFGEFAGLSPDALRRQFQTVDV